MDTLRTRYPPHLDYKKPQKVARACPRPENAIFEKTLILDDDDVDVDCDVVR